MSISRSSHVYLYLSLSVSSKFTSAKIHHTLKGLLKSVLFCTAVILAWNERTDHSVNDHILVTNSDFQSVPAVLLYRLHLTGLLVGL